MNVKFEKSEIKIPKIEKQMKIIDEKEDENKIREVIKRLKLVRNVLVNVKNGLVAFKMFFFNALYELFSVYIVWISILGFFHLTGLYKIILIDERQFFEISTVFGLLFGIFQFLLQRYEEKILAKINVLGNRIEQIINQELTFEKFYDSIPEVDKQKKLKRWIQKNIDPKLQMRDFFIFLMEDRNTRELFFNHIDKFPISVNVSYQNSNQKYYVLDMAANDNANMKRNLHEAYRSFFLDPENIDELIKKINKEIDLKDFRLVVLSNINIISEIIPQFTNNNFKQLLGYIVSEDDKINQEYIAFDSSKEYQQYLHNQVCIKLMKGFLS
ncbi:hypothetical protein [Methanosarcina sp. UBA411]|uniref:hypothetical protein n=1 Tax=Methanosarcina sp. UBA411 TaxID=1915589 RepID=UPI0025F47D79|nr:hypothetical protein [Methanosarcina sp. UBA411]